MDQILIFHEDNILIRIIRNPKSLRGSIQHQIVVPQHLTQNIISMAHAGFPYGHLGCSATYYTVKANFFWPKMC